MIYTDWKLVKDDAGRLHSAKPLHCFSIHHWLVNTVQLSPFFKDIVLTTGSWNFAIWKEGVMDGPIIESPRFEKWCTAGCWSLSRPAVFFIGKEDGSIEVWNLLENTNEPAQVHPLFTNAKITCIKPWTASRHPDDIVPMVLTSATQELFGCRADEDVTGESPYKLLKKDDIIRDFKTRAKASDFNPVKQIVLDYPEDELLLVFDRDLIYGQRFYLVLTPEAKERILNVGRLICRLYRTLPKNMSTQYTPRELSSEEADNILQSDSMKDFLKSVTARMLYALQQEGIMNVFFDDWKALGTAAKVDWSGKDFKGLKHYQAFSDQHYTKDKKISSVNWHPTIYGVIAVALTVKRQEQESTTFGSEDSLILFYSFSDPSNAQLLLECPDDIFAFEFCPSDPNIIVGGCKNGQVVLWDISAHVAHLQGTQPVKKVSVYTDTYDLDSKKENKTPAVPYCAVSGIDSSHKAPITDVHWLPSTFEVHRAEGQRGWKENIK
ncbi:dynein axonemal intermediate chain 3-like [Lycodopsis pacificus]